LSVYKKNTQENQTLFVAFAFYAFLSINSLASENGCFLNGGNVVLSLAQAEGNICESYDSLPVLSDLAARTSGNTITWDQMPICDDYLTEQWYRMDNYVLTSSTSGCDTWDSWYTRGKLSKNNACILIIHETFKSFFKS